MIYQWGGGAHNASIVGLSAQKVGERFERLRAKHGGLTADVILRDARPEGSLLHRAFEWDDKRAATEFRLRQARDLVAAVVTVISEGGESRTIRAFVQIEREGESAYTATADALADPALRRQVLNRAARELELWEHRYRELAELSEVFVAAARVRERVAS